MIPGSVTPLLLKKAAVDTGYNIERSLRFNSSDSDFEGGTAPTLSTAANARDCLVYAVQSSTKITAVFLKGLS